MTIVGATGRRRRVHMRTFRLVGGAASPRTASRGRHSGCRPSHIPSLLRPPSMRDDSNHGGVATPPNPPGGVETILEPGLGRPPDDGWPPSVLPPRKGRHMSDRDLTARTERLHLRRAWGRLALTLLLPGSAQLASGNKRLGRVAVRVYAVLWGGLLLLYAVLFLVNRGGRRRADHRASGHHRGEHRAGSGRDRRGTAHPRRLAGVPAAGADHRPSARLRRGGGPGPGTGADRRIDRLGERDDRAGRLLLHRLQGWGGRHPDQGRPLQRAAARWGGCRHRARGGCARTR